MAGHSVLVPNILTAPSAWTKLAIALAIIASPMMVQAAPADMGSFTIKSRGDGWASGDYTASGTAPNDSGLWGAFTITREEMNGYTNGPSFTPTRNDRTSSNGVEIKNESNTSSGQDKFTYTITITPHDNTAVHSIKIGQASYGTSGNSEIARQTLSYTPNNNINVPAKAFVKSNDSVNYFYNAMGDYFMGKKLDGNSFSSANPIRSPQLRFDSSNGGNSGLYYYGITTLSGNGNSSSFIPNTTDGQVRFATTTTNGALPGLATFTNILKSTSTDPNNQSTYGPLPVNYVIANGSSYVSYGIENSASNYVVEVKNAKTVTLTYKGIMNGNAAEPGNVIGETFNEWISFGVTSEPYASHKHTFSGTVFNDNGGINDSQANASTTGGMYNNNQYFNGIFNTPTEKGITGSTVALVDKCVNPTKTYATQTLTSTNDIGKYELNVLSSTLKDQSSVCIVETYNSNTYPVQTTASTKLINLATDNYDNHNFGRVIAANAALVLDKSQYVHDCSLKDLMTIGINYDGLPTVAFSKKSIDKIEPGQCIAYRIQAINRGNVPLTDIIIKDILQKIGEGNAFATSTLVIPEPIGENGSAPTFSNNSVAIGNNGQIITNGFILGTTASDNRKAIRFNTKYGSVANN